MKFKLKVGESKYVLTFSPAAVSLLVQLMTLKSMPSSEAEKKVWEEEVNRGWRMLIDMVCDPKPREGDVLVVMLALIQAGGDLINRISMLQLEKVMNS
ncbi:hypothetical protein DRJ16_06815 [Candidatus Woesearchaeota archaeon]|nr:MAG: hypothetical protein DRJ16_06815 [Candidatus Woesearchaeota archaeon]